MGVCLGKREKKLLVKSSKENDKNSENSETHVIKNSNEAIIIENINIKNDVIPEKEISHKRKHKRKLTELVLFT